MIKPAKKVKLVVKNGKKKSAANEERKTHRQAAVIRREVKDFLNDFRTKVSEERRNELLGNLLKVLQDESIAEKKPQPIDFKKLAYYANPAVDTVTQDIGVYNPDTIDASTYELMRKDPQLAAGLALIKLPIMSLPWRIESDDEDVANTCAFILKPVWKSLIKTMLTGVDFGFAAHEKVWERKNIAVQSMRKTSEGSKERKKTHYKGDAVVFRKIKPLHPTSIAMKFKDDEFQGLIQTSPKGEEVEVPARKAFVFTHDEEFGNMFGKSRLKPAYKIWYWKELLYQFMLQYYERRGTPTTVVTAPPGKTVDSDGNQKDNIQLALELGASLINNSVAALPYEESQNGSDNMWSIDYLQDDRRGTMFVDAIKHLEAKCFLALWVPEDLGDRGARGSFAQTTVIVDLFLMSEKGLITEIEDHVNKFLLPQIISFNFPPEKRSRAYFKMDQLDWNRRLAVKEIFIEMLKNVDTMVQVGILPRLIPDFEKMAEILEIPMSTFDEATSENDNDDNSPSGSRVKPRRRNDPGRNEPRVTVRPGTKPTEQQRTRVTVRRQ